MHEASSFPPSATTVVSLGITTASCRSNTRGQRDEDRREARRSSRFHKARLRKSQRTVDFQGGVSSDFFSALEVQRGARIYSLILKLHVGQHLHVCVPQFPRLQKGQHLLINAKLPTSKSVSTVPQGKGDFLTISCMIVNEAGMFPLPWQ